jgi:hypothetical protein
MHMKSFYLVVLFLAPAFLRAQAISINTDASSPDPSAILDVKSTEKGMLVPRMTTAQRNLIAAPATGLLVFDTDSGGFWFFNGTAWTDLSGSGAPAMFIADTDGNTKVQTEKNPNEDVIRFDLGGAERMALKKNVSGTSRLELPNASNNSFVGTAAGSANTTGFANTSLGTNSLAANTTGFANTSLGTNSLAANTTGFGNTSLGTNSLAANTTGFGNTATGNLALVYNTSGNANSGFGVEALKFNTTGNNNTAIGLNALANNTTGNNNTATGYAALADNKANSRSTAIGYLAMWHADDRTTGRETFNTAIGYEALLGSLPAANNTGQFNTAVGDHALYSNTSGIANTASGVNALASNTTGNGNIAQGLDALLSNITGSNNIAIGTGADVTASNLTNATAIGYAAKVGASNSLVLGGTDADAVNVGIGTQTPTTAKLVINTTAGSTGIDLSTADAYAEMRVIRNTLNAVDNDIYLGFGSSPGSATHIYSDGIETLVAINQEVGIRRYPVTNALEVEGDASKSTAGDWLANSDARLKKNIAPLNSHEMLDKLLTLQGVTYEWNDNKTGSKRPEGIQYGFTAQNIQTVFPTLVEEDKLGFLQTAYGTYDAMTVEAIRALYDEIKALKLENTRQKTENAEMKAQLDKITAALQTSGIGVGN